MVIKEQARSTWHHPQGSLKYRDEQADQDLKEHPYPGTEEEKRWPEKMGQGEPQEGEILKRSGQDGPVPGRVRQEPTSTWFRHTHTPLCGQVAELDPG